MSSNPSALDQFRQSLITSSVAAASQRVSAQRRALASGGDAHAAAQYRAMTEAHCAAAASELRAFGCTATVSTPAGLLESPGSKGDVLVSSTRVMVSCAVPSSAAATNNNSNSNHHGRVAMGLDDGAVTVWGVPSGAWQHHGTDPMFRLAASAVRGIAVSPHQAVALGASASAPSSSFLMASAHRNGCLAIWSVPRDAPPAATGAVVQADAAATAAVSFAGDAGPLPMTPLIVVEAAHGLLPRCSALGADASAPAPDASMGGAAAVSSVAATGRSLRRCQWSPTMANILATSGDDGTVRIWAVSLPSHASSSSSNNDAARIECLMCLANGSDIAPGSTSAAVSLTAASPMPPTRCVAFHPDGALLAVGDASGSLTVWDLRDATRIFTSVGPKPAHSGRVNAVAFSPNGYNISTGGDDGLVICYDLRRMAAGPPPPPASVAVAAAAAAAPSSGSAQPPPPPHNQHLHPVVWRQAAHGDAVTDIAYGAASPALGGAVTDAAIVLSAGLDGLVVAWDAWTGERLWRSSAAPSYVPGLRVQSSAPLPSVRSLCFVFAERAGRTTTAPSSAASCATATSNVHGDDGSDVLVVMCREPQWRMYAAGGAILGASKAVVTRAHIVAGAPPSMRAAGAAGGGGGGGGNGDAAAHAGDSDGAADDDDSDDDIMGSLRGKAK